MIRRTQFLVHDKWHGTAIDMFDNALVRMPQRPLYVTIEIEPQYEKLRSKLAKRAAKKRRRQVKP